MKAQTGESMEVIDLVQQGLHLKKGLVPTDFSDGSKKAVQYALRFAEQFGCDIALLYVVEPTTPMIGAPLAVEACTDKDEFSIAEKDLAALAAEPRTAVGIPLGHLFPAGLRLTGLRKSPRTFKPNSLMSPRHASTRCRIW